MKKNKRRIKEQNQNIIIEGVTDFNVAQTLECGQCFRFDKIDENEYVIVAKGHLLHIKQEDSKVIFYETSKQLLEDIWLDYFDLKRDYSDIKKYLLERDSCLEEPIKEKYGVRILQQEFHEMLISFVISQNKQIPHIKKIIRDLSKRYGEYLGTINEQNYYTFPTVDALGKITEEEFRELKTGFRAPYLCDASRKLQYDLVEKDLRMLSYEAAKEELIKIRGVGDKVANCVLLFGLGYRNAFPIDVWVKRIMENVYFKREASKEEIKQLAIEKFGEYGGYAQQYLFYFARDNKVHNVNTNM